MHIIHHTRTLQYVIKAANYVAIFHIVHWNNTAPNSGMFKLLQSNYLNRPIHSVSHFPIVSVIELQILFWNLIRNPLETMHYVLTHKMHGEECKSNKSKHFENSNVPMLQFHVLFPFGNDECAHMFGKCVSKHRKF